MILFYVLKIVIGVVNSVYVAGTPQEDINVEFNGYEYRYDFPFAGYMKLGHDYYPGYVQPVSGKFGDGSAGTGAFAVWKKGVEEDSAGAIAFFAGDG